ncbi:tyrosine-protein phosphatase [Niabella ginsengisoli]|uniref:protein-tyrosine-phosphatase n=1 Tax=Niabella ginsengisoli TaxID=522298 RepID=A0ABS9SDU8_9BACT|nr:CpsB/CapC family capsule biosynthesis tyrosine phosphatase [Niabella ginsengisoli]MCH5596531.1 histidinol phosphatase [Niabella ginsengisoli]
MHSHLLPGIDDGASDMETSMELIEGLKNQGYSKLITTPHILWDIYKNTPEIIHSKLDDVREELNKRSIDIEIHAAAEYFLDDHLSELLQKKEPLLTVKDNMVLVEFSVMHMSMNMKEILFDVQMAGYQPILAHPERYTYLYKQYDVLHDLKDNGCMFQLNLLSATGGYGKTVSEMANYFVKHDFYDFIGTDMHHTGHLARLKTINVSQEVKTLVNSGRIVNNQL